MITVSVACSLAHDMLTRYLNGKIFQEAAESACCSWNQSLLKWEGWSDLFLWKTGDRLARYLGLWTSGSKGSIFYYCKRCTCSCSGPDEVGFWSLGLVVCCCLLTHVCKMAGFMAVFTGLSASWAFLSSMLGLATIIAGLNIKFCEFSSFRKLLFVVLGCNGPALQ